MIRIILILIRIIQGLILCCLILKMHKELVSEALKKRSEADLTFACVNVDDERPRTVQQKLKQMFDQQSWSDCVDTKHLLHLT